MQPTLRLTVVGPRLIWHRYADEQERNTLVTPSQILLPVVVALMTIVVNAIVNTTIKFAPDAASARNELVALVLRLLAWLSTAYSAGWLLYFGFSDGPVTRANVVAAVVAGGNLLIAVTFRQILRVVDLVGHVVESHAKSSEALFNVHAKHVELTRSLTEAATGKASTTDNKADTA